MRHRWICFAAMGASMLGLASAAQEECSMLPAEPPAGLPPIRVRLVTLGTPRQVTLRATGPVTLTRLPSGEQETLDASSLTVANREGKLEAGETRGSSFRLEAGSLAVEVGKSTRVYPGALILSPSGHGVSIVNECSLEEYTEGVLAGECPALFHIEAIKAMAVAARSYSYRKAYLGKEGLCDTTHCHLYRGRAGVRPTHQEAVRATAGLCALYEGEVIDAVYSSDCGGHTEGNDEAWKTKPLPYLRPVEDAPEPGAPPFCAVNRAHEWRLTVTKNRLQSLYGHKAKGLKVEVLEHSESGRVRRLQLAAEEVETDGPSSGEPGETRTAEENEKPARGAKPPKAFTGEQWRRLLGVDSLRSLHFTVQETEGGIELYGRGWGHGVGLCQFGANGRAKQGAPFDRILKAYYTGIEVAPPPVPAAAVMARRAGTRTGS